MEHLSIFALLLKKITIPEVQETMHLLPRCSLVSIPANSNAGLRRSYRDKQLLVQYKILGEAGVATTGFAVSGTK